MSIKIPNIRKETSSTLVTISAAAIALLLASPLIFSNILLQPVQATGKNMLGLTSIQTPNPVALGDFCNVANAQITFNAQSDDNGATLTSGTFTVTNSSNSSQIWWSGDIHDATANGDAQDETVDIYYNVDKNGLNGGEFCGAGTLLSILTYCTQSPLNPNIILSTSAIYGGVNGKVDCEYQSDTTAHPSSSSSMTAGSSQATDRGSGSSSSNSTDSDSDGIPDSSDRCTHNSNPKCFKEEGDTSSTTTTTTTHEQQPSSSSSSSSGNQTR